MSLMSPWLILLPDIANSWWGKRPFFYFSISLTERNNGTIQKLPFEINTTIGFKNITSTSGSNVIQRNVFGLRSMLVLWDVQGCW